MVTNPPSAQNLYTLFFGRVKRCKLIQRRIDRAKDASPDSHRRTFDWLFGKIKTALWEMREDQNEESIKHALSPSKTQRDRRQAKGATVGEEKGSELSKAMPASKAKAKPSQPAKGDGKGKGKGDQASKGPPPVSKAQPNVAKAKASADPKGKPSVPCFFPRVHAIVVQNVLLHTWIRHQQPRRRPCACSKSNGCHCTS